ncbi:MAG: sensor histidine kinase [Specibacter sp.]
MNAARGGPHLGLVVTAIAAIQVVGTHFAANRAPGSRALDWLGYALLLAGPLLLLLWRRAPEFMLVCVVAVTGAYFLLRYPWGPAPTAMAMAIVLVTAARRRAFSWTVSGTVVGVLLLAAVLRGGDLALVRAVAVSAWLVIMVLVGEAVRARIERAQESRARRLAAQARAEDEYRLTLARDIHDVVAHSLSMINVRASVALHLADRDPGQLRPALEAIKEASKDSLDQVRVLLGVLRRDAPLQPGLTLAHLPQLVQDAKGAGLAATLECDVEPGLLRERLGPEGEAVVYRMVQEAVTNVIRHAEARRVVLRLALGSVGRGPGLLVSVEDNGHGMRGAAEGNGLRGMRERLAAVGGSLTMVGLHPGTRALAVIPLGAGLAASPPGEMPGASPPADSRPGASPPAETP